jgi:hypothetical protein
MIKKGSRRAVGVWKENAMKKSWWLIAGILIAYGLSHALSEVLAQGRICRDDTKTVSIQNRLKRTYIGQGNLIMPDRVGPGERWEPISLGDCWFGIRNIMKGYYLDDRGFSGSSSHDSDRWQITKDGECYYIQSGNGQYLSQDRRLVSIPVRGPGECWIINVID